MTPILPWAPSGHLSRKLVILVSVLFTAGVSTGWLSYVHGSAATVGHVPGSNAWWQQAGVAALCCALLVARRLRRGGGADSPGWLLGPLSRTSASRIVLAGRAATRRPAGVGRALLACPLMLVFGYGFFRAGFQVTSGLDPNNTVNAWGGPSYLGAMACHYLDLLVIMTAAVWLLNRLLPPIAGEDSLHRSAA